ncbi:MAG TPA: glycine cleavage T C-terminal barrel domain-containing protein [Acidimicrobiales bacterium]|nr:glycine cleavage T C-terminal barrel domain-containing protein [Acidimicrobiales bacterium]
MTDVGIVDLYVTLGAVEVSRDVVRVSGPDAVAYLQGQLSQNVEDLDVGATTWTFVLQPTGKVDVWGRVTRTADDTFVLDVEAGSGESLVGRLKRFLMRTKAEVELLDDWRCIVLRGPGAVEAAAAAEVTAAVRVPAGWPGVEGACLLGPDVALPAGIPLVSPEAVEATRITAGVPAMGAELTERTIPAEAGQWVIDASVDFTKGCFTGQELVARIDSRGGNVPRHLRGLVLDPEATLPAPGSRVRVGDAEVGEVTSAAYSPALGAPVALAYVGRSVEPPAEATVVTDDDKAAAQVRQLPLVG